MHSLEKRTKQLEDQFGENKPPFTRLVLVGVEESPKVAWEHPLHDESNASKPIKITIGGV